jgi:signal transduction histidine kinase
LPLFFFCTAAFARPSGDSTYIDIALLKDSVYLYNCLAFLDSSISTEHTALQNWQPLSAYKIKKFIPGSWIHKTVYLKFSLWNNSNTADTVFFFPGVSFSSIKVFKASTGNQVEQVKDLSRTDGYQPLAMAAGEKQVFVAELEFTRTMFNRLVPQLIKKSYLNVYQRNHYFTNISFLLFGYLFSGIILMMTFFSAANYFLSQKKEFLYNSCYAACIFLLVFGSTYVDKRSGLLASTFTGYFAFSLLAIGTVFYIAFTRKFLETTINYPKLNQVFLLAEKIFILLWVCFTFLHFFTSNFTLQHLLENIMKFSALALGLAYIAIALVQKDRFMNYLALGNGILILLSSVSLYVLLSGIRENSIFSRSIFYYEVGIAGELMFFLIGLTYKNRIGLIEKTKEQEALKLESEKQGFETKLAVLNAQQKERNRISADMHDDLGSGITAIRLYSELAKTRLGNEPVPEIEKISSSANELLNNMNAIIWTMNSSNDTLENMIAYIRSYAQEYLDTTGTACKFSIEEDLPNIAVSGQIRRNVFLVIKETLNNILKHAKATEVNISLLKVADGLSLFIHDNGIGIDLNNIRRFGNGLANMKKRMEEMGIDFLIENKNGTLVTLHYKMEF